MSAYTYDPANIGVYGPDRMRFELGDVPIEGAEGGPCCVLSDAEIAALLAAHPDDWRAAKLRLVESVLRRLSFEVDTKIAPAEWKWHQRYEAWKAMYDEIKKEAEGLCTPRSGIVGKGRGRPYFYENMMNNPPAPNPGR